MPLILQPVRRDLQGSHLSLRLRLLHETDDPPAVVQLHDTQARNLAAGHGNDGNGDVRLAFLVRLQQFAKVHAVQLVARQHQDLTTLVLLDVTDLLAHGVGGALIPVRGLVRLLGGQNLDETLAKRVELVGIGDVPVQTHAQKLRQHVNAVEAAIDAVADGNVDQPVFSGQGNGWLAPQLGEGIQAGPPTTAQNQAQNITHDNPLWSGRRSTISGPSNTVFC